MAFDARREDYQRLGLRFARSLDGMDAEQAARAFATFGMRFAREHDTLPQTDSDRAFHLVAHAAQLIDYELPFVELDRANEIIEEGHRTLDEALALDSHCYDALRMLEASRGPSFEDFLSTLIQRVDEVRDWCDLQRSEVTGDPSDERTRLALDLAQRPYLRWLATMCDQALICGHNLQALEFGRRALEVDPRDQAGVSLTMLYAYAKLEQADELEEFLRERREQGHGIGERNAWLLIARMALAYKRYDMSTARKHLSTLIASYANADYALVRQIELYAGVFSRQVVIPQSEDEIILALSEAMPLLEEGADPRGKGSFSNWVLFETTRQHPEAMLMAMAEERQFGQEDHT